MSISMRELFSRQDIAGEIISLRNSLANHPQGLQMSLREAHGRLLELNAGDGFSRGCRRPGKLEIDLGFDRKDVGVVLPAWVPVSRNTETPHRRAGGQCIGIAHFGVSGAAVDSQSDEIVVAQR